MTLENKLYELRNTFFMYGPVFGKNIKFEGKLSENIPLNLCSFVGYEIMNGVTKPKTYINCQIKDDKERPYILIGGKHKITQKNANPLKIMLALEAIIELNNEYDLMCAQTESDSKMIKFDEPTKKNLEPITQNIPKETITQNIPKDLSENKQIVLLQINGDNAQFLYDGKENIFEIKVCSSLNDTIKVDDIDSAERIWDLITERPIQGKKAKMTSK